MTSTDHVSTLAALTAAADSGALGWAAATDPRYRRAYRIARTADVDIPPAADVVGVTYWADRNQRWLPYAVHRSLTRPAVEVLEDDTLTPLTRSATIGISGQLALLALAVAAAAAIRDRINGRDAL